MSPVKTTTKRKVEGRKEGEQSGKGKVSSQAGSKINKMIHSSHLLSQKITKQKKSTVKKVIPFTHAKLCHAIMAITKKEHLV